MEISPYIKDKDTPENRGVFEYYNYSGYSAKGAASTLSNRVWARF